MVKINKNDAPIKSPLQLPLSILAASCSQEKLYLRKAFKSHEDKILYWASMEKNITISLSDFDPYKDCPKSLLPFLHMHGILLPFSFLWAFYDFNQSWPFFHLKTVLYLDAFCHSLRQISRLQSQAENRSRVNLNVITSDREESIMLPVPLQREMPVPLCQQLKK